MIDAKAFGLELAGMVKAQLGPIITRLDALERRIDALPVPVDLSSDLAEVKAAVDGIVIPDIPPAPELPDIAAMVDQAVKHAVSVAISENPAPRDGKSVTVEDVAPIIASEVKKHLSEMPKPKDGEPGRDGLDVKEMFRAEGGRLVAVMSDGTTRDLGVFVGKDGDPGKDGADGVGFDDLDVTYDGEKTITLKFTKGDRVKEFAFTMPVVIDRGVYREGQEYKAGDAVTWAGSVWIAQKDTSVKPDTGDDWRLSVKRGRDGKDGTMKEAKVAQPVRVGVPSSKES